MLKTSPNVATFLFLGYLNLIKENDSLMVWTLLLQTVPNIL